MNEQEYQIPDWRLEPIAESPYATGKGKVIYMNEKALSIFAKSGDMRGRNLMPCHSERSRQIIAHMLSTGESNVYRIRKNGLFKIIYQTPWRKDGEIAGLVEISMEVPEELRFYDRDAE